jgi:hypothetical protein
MEDFISAIVRAAFNEGESAVGGASEADCFDDGSEEAREEWGAGMEV